MCLATGGKDFKAQPSLHMNSVRMIPRKQILRGQDLSVLLGDNQSSPVIDRDPEAAKEVEANQGINTPGLFKV